MFFVIILVMLFQDRSAIYAVIFEFNVSVVLVSVPWVAQSLMFAINKCDKKCVKKLTNNTAPSSLNL